MERLKVIYDKGGRSPLDDGVAEVRQLCISVEEVLRHQQKGGLLFMGWSIGVPMYQRVNDVSDWLMIN